MAIEKNNFKVLRLDSEFSPRSRESMLSENRKALRRGSGVESDDDDVFNDCDSGAGSDDFDLLELGEVGEEFCQVGKETCSIPFELYDLFGLGEILSMDVWNECLTEEERFSLTKYLPDMDQEMFMRTLKQIFIGSNLHFGSPLTKLFDMLKGGLCEPRVSLYQQGLISFQKRQHCHLVRKYHNTMVVNLHQIKDAWLKCKGYSIEEKLQVLNIVKSQKSLMNEDTEELGSDAYERNGYQRGFSSKNKNFKFSIQGKAMPLRQERLGYLNPKRTPKLGGTKSSPVKEVSRRFPFYHNNGLDTMLGPSTSSLGGSARENKFSGYSLEAPVPMMDQIKDEDDEETAYRKAFLRGHNTSQAGASDNAGPLRIGNNIEGLRDDEYHTDNFMGYPGYLVKDIHAYGGNRNVDKLSDIKVSTAKPYKTRISSDNGKKVKYPVKVQQFPVVEQMKYGESQAPKSLMKGNQYAFNGFEPFWHKKAHGEAFSADISPEFADHIGGSKNWKIGEDSSDYKFSNKLYFPEYDANKSHGKITANSMQNGRHGGRYAKCEETESDSSESIDDEDGNPLMRTKLANRHEALNGSRLQFKRHKSSNKVKKGGAQTHDKLPQFSRKTENSLLSGSGRFTEDDRQLQTFDKKKHMQGAYSSGFHVPPLKSYPIGRKQREEYGHNLPVLVEDTEIDGSLGKKGKGLETYGDDFHEINDAPLSYPKWKVRDVAPLFDERDSNVNLSQQQLENTTSSRKNGKRKIDGSFVASEMGISEPSVVEMVDADVEQEPRSLKKPFTPITPTVHSGFSFSVIHLLSAVRMAMVTLLPEDTLEMSGTNGAQLHDLDMNKSEHSTHSKVPSLTIQEIVNRVRSNPGDPCILETQEPLQDLVRGVLKIFSSKTAPLGAKGWKSLVLYEKTTKSWSWTGPVPKSLSEHEVSEEVTSPEAWLLPLKMLVKLVDAFANWLKRAQEPLQQIGSLNPPLSLLQFNVDEKERFRDLRAQKSLNTISPSTEEIRDYFRKEEFLRYSIPDRAFSYTAIDGKKSIVAPLRRCGGKPTSKARDHFMLKRDRPPHVTILCLVRDAACRLPGSIGTRADVCTLIRDSQYIVEDVSDAQVNQVVSGALDRLHYERDPCVQFDSERKLWVYLHRDREEEDFEDDGTSSTKKWKKQKKEAPETFEQEMVTVACQGDGEQNGLNLGSDLNAEPSYEDEHKAMNPLSFDGNQRMEGNLEIGGGLGLGAVHQNSTMAWSSLGLNTTREDKFLCQVNSKNNDFDDMFVREPPDQFLSTSLS